MARPPLPGCPSAVHEGNGQGGMRHTSCTGPLYRWGNRGRVRRQLNSVFIAKPSVTFLPRSEHHSRTRLQGNACSWEQSVTFLEQAAQVAEVAEVVAVCLFLSSACQCAYLCLSGSVTLRGYKGTEGKGGFIHHLPRRRRPPRVC